MDEKKEELLDQLETNLTETESDFYSLEPEDDEEESKGGVIGKLIGGGLLTAAIFGIVYVARKRKKSRNKEIDGTDKIRPFTGTEEGGSEEEKANANNEESSVSN